MHSVLTFLLLFGDCDTGKKTGDGCFDGGGLDWWLRAFSFTVKLQSTNIGFLVYHFLIQTSQFVQTLAYRKNIELQLSSYASNICYTCLTEALPRSLLMM